MTGTLFQAAGALLLGAALLLTGCGRASAENELEQAAVPVVTDIIRNQLKGSASCVGVKLSRKLSGKHYQAVASLSNGKEVRILIEDRGGTIVVTIPKQE